MFQPLVRGDDDLILTNAFHGLRAHIGTQRQAVNPQNAPTRSAQARAGLNGGNREVQAHEPAAGGHCGLGFGGGAGHGFGALEQIDELVRAPIGLPHVAAQHARPGAAARAQRVQQAAALYAVDARQRIGLRERPQAMAQAATGVEYGGAGF